MHQLFMVGAKLLGIYFIINGLIAAFMLANPGTAGPFANQMAVSCLVSFTAGTALAFFTGIVARVLRVQEQWTDQTPSFSYRSALEVGIVLLGLLQVLSVLPRVVLHVTDYSQRIVQTRSPQDLLSLEAIGLAAALLMVCFAHRIAAVLERVNRQSSGP